MGRSSLSAQCNPPSRLSVRRVRYLIPILLAGAWLSVGCGGVKMASSSSSPSSSPAAGGSLSASNSTLNFGNVQVGSTKAMSLVLTNAGTPSTPVQILNVTVSGNGFHASGVTPPLTLNGGQSLTLNISFDPSAAGEASGSISVASTATNSAVSVALSGSGLASGQLVVSPTSLDFSSVTIGSSQSQNATLSAGSSSITISSASWTGAGFSVGGISFPVTISAGQSVPFVVTFTPQTGGTATGSVAFLSNATNSPTSESLAGTAVQPTQHSVSLSWHPDTSPVQGYYVYRGGQAGGPYTRISTLQAGTSFTDTTVAPATTYYYVVTALGTNSEESGYSNQVAAVIP